ncbi:MAG: Mfa1 family fimbria major subunit [Duncaniella sp.]|nr:Mfa1 family fimbria major subunit [Duncaniella sp.]
MKINKFLLGAFALSVGFASCSNEEPIKGENGGGTTDGEKYVSVRINSVGNPGSRAATDNGFEGPAVGSAEGTLTKDDIRFYFFTADGMPFVMSQTGVAGTVTKTNMVKPESLSVSNTDGEQGSIDAVLVLGKEDKYVGNRPAIMFCVANATDEAAFEQFAQKRLDALPGIEVNIPGEWSKFRMTSSTYLDKNGKVIYYTDISDNVKDTKKDAMDNPADIYLERLAAKIRVKGLGEYSVMEKNDDGTLTTAQYKIRDENGTTTTALKVDLLGWEPYMTANRCYAVKNIDKTWTNENLFNGWNNSDLHRCYWATDPGIVNPNNNTIPLYDNNKFKYGNYDGDNPTENIVYTYENTSYQPASVTDRSTKATAILVKAVVKRDGSDEGINMVEWGSDYFTLAYFKQVVVEAYNADKDVTNRASVDDVVLKENTDTDALANTWYVTVKGDDFKRFSDIYWWQNGITSYFVNVEHLGSKYGVVRNHIYDYTFNNVVGLGVPGDDPVNPEEKKPSYLAARVNVLNWHLISNTVTLE